MPMRLHGFHTGRNFISESEGGWVGASAPGRAGIIGNPSDIYGGTVVSSSIEERNRCWVRRTAENRWPQEDRLIKAAVTACGIDFPFQLKWHSDIPVSSGLSGSTSALASALLALSVLKSGERNLDPVGDKQQFAEWVRRTERYEAGIMCGFQDAHMIVNGGVQCMDFPGRFPITDRVDADFAPVSLQPLHCDLPFLLITTGVERVSGSVHEPLAQRWLRGENLVKVAMERIGELGRIGTVALSNSDFDGLAAAMNENHHLVQELGSTGPEVDRLVSHCLQEGALGAKLAGAGMGGTVIALTNDVNELQTRLGGLGYTRFLKLNPQEGLRLELARKNSLN